MALTAQCPLLEINFSIRFSSMQSYTLCVLHRACIRLGQFFSVGHFPWPCPEFERLTFTDGITRLFSLWPPVGVCLWQGLPGWRLQVRRERGQCPNPHPAHGWFSFARFLSADLPSTITAGSGSHHKLVISSLLVLSKVLTTSLCG